MKKLCYGAAAVLLLTVSAGAQNQPTQDPNKLTVQTQRSTLQLNDEQRGDIQAALATENTQQKTPVNFEPKVGDTIPLTMTVDVMPPQAVAKNPSLQPFGYAKIGKDVLVIDPMEKKIVAIIPRQEPNTAKDVAPADWAKTKGRELTGQQPESSSSSSSAPAHEPAGDSGDKSNGNEQKTQ